MKYRIPTILALLFVSLASRAQQQSGISGKIADAEGAAIGGAHVVIHWDPSGSSVGLADNIGIKNDLVVSTDNSGIYRADVPPGFYDIFVSATSFSPTAAKVRVKNNQAITYNSKLKADPLVARELAH